MLWGTGPCLLKAINLVVPPKHNPEKPLRITVSNVHRIIGVGNIVVSRVETGSMDVMTNVSIIHVISGKCGYRRGPRDWHDYPGAICNSFIAKVLVLHHPTQIKAGYTPVLHCHLAYVPCRFAELLSKIDRKTGVVIDEEPTFIKNMTVFWLK